MTSPRKKVLHIKYTLNPGGGCMIIYRFAQQLKDRYRFDWMTYSMTGNDWAYKFEELGGTTQFFPGPENSFRIRTIVRNTFLYIRYIHYVRSNHYDIVHVNTENPVSVRFLICAYLGGAKKRVLHSHSNGSVGVKNDFRTKFYRWLIGFFATDYIACSREAAEWLFPEKYVRKSIILKNGLDIDSFKYNKQMRINIRAQYGIEEYQYVIGHIGRFVSVKNHKFLLETFGEVIKKYPDSLLMILGSGPLENQIRDQIKELNIENHVIFVGQVDNVQDYLNAMDVFVLPSIFEGLGMVNIEAQTNGLCCVVSDRVSRLAKVTDLIDFLPLEEGKNLWADHLLAKKDLTVHREDYAEIVRNAGWDIKDIAQTLSEVYGS